MGVKDLWTILSPVMTSVPLADLRGQTLAVDLSIWVVETQGVRQMQGVVTKPYLRNLFFRVNHLLQLGINLIFVIEGEAPELKWETMAQRTQTRYGAPGRGRGHHGVTSHKPKRSHFKAVIRECCQLLDEIGIPYVQSAGEAEANCAFLNAKGVVDACLTDDGDAFLYGARKVYRNFTMNLKDPHVESYDMADIEDKLALDRSRLVALGLLIGCDYVPRGVPGVGREMALKFFTYIGAQDVLKRFDFWMTNKAHFAELETISSSKKVQHCNQCGHPGSARKHEKSGCPLCGSTKHCDPQPYDHACACDWHRKQQELAACSTELNIQKRAVRAEGFPWPKVVQEFIRSKDRIPPKPLQWRSPRLLTFMSFCEVKLDWVKDYSREKILPLITLWSMRAQLGRHGNLKRPVLEPYCILKTRVRSGMPCVEVQWYKLYEDSDYEGDYYTTIEQTDIFKNCFSEIVESFEASKPVKATQRKAKVKSRESDKENVDLNKITTEMEDIKLTNDSPKSPMIKHQPGRQIGESDEETNSQTSPFNTSSLQAEQENNIDDCIEIPNVPDSHGYETNAPISCSPKSLRQLNEDFALQPNRNPFDVIASQFRGRMDSRIIRGTEESRGALLKQSSVTGVAAPSDSAESCGEVDVCMPLSQRLALMLTGTHTSAQPSSSVTEAGPKVNSRSEGSKFNSKSGGPKVNSRSESPEVNTRFAVPKVNTKYAYPKVNTRSESPEINTSSEGPKVNEMSAYPKVNTRSERLEVNTRSEGPEVNTRSEGSKVNTKSAYPEVSTRLEGPKVNKMSAYPKVNTRSESPEVNTRSEAPMVNTKSAYPEVNTRSESLKINEISANPNVITKSAYPEVNSRSEGPIVKAISAYPKVNTKSVAPKVNRTNGSIVNTKSAYSKVNTSSEGPEFREINTYKTNEEVPTSCYSQSQVEKARILNLHSGSRELRQKSEPTESTEKAKPIGKNDSKNEEYSHLESHDCALKDPEHNANKMHVDIKIDEPKVRTKRLSQKSRSSELEEHSLQKEALSENISEPNNLGRPNYMHTNHDHNDRKEMCIAKDADIVVPIDKSEQVCKKKKNSKKRIKDISQPWYRNALDFSSDDEDILFNIPNGKQYPDDRIVKGNECSQVCSKSSEKTVVTRSHNNIERIIDLEYDKDQPGVKEIDSPDGSAEHAESPNNSRKEEVLKSNGPVQETMSTKICQEFDGGFLRRSSTSASPYSCISEDRDKTTHIGNAGQVCELEGGFIREVSQEYITPNIYGRFSNDEMDSENCEPNHTGSEYWDASCLVDSHCVGSPAHGYLSELSLSESLDIHETSYVNIIAHLEKTTGRCSVFQQAHAVNIQRTSGCSIEDQTSSESKCVDRSIEEAPSAEFADTSFSSPRPEVRERETHECGSHESMMSQTRETDMTSSAVVTNQIDYSSELSLSESLDIHETSYVNTIAHLEKTTGRCSVFQQAHAVNIQRTSGCSIEDQTSSESKCVDCSIEEAPSAIFEVREGVTQECGTRESVTSQIRDMTSSAVVTNQNTWNRSQLGSFTMGASLLNISCDSEKVDISNCGDVSDVFPPSPHQNSDCGQTSFQQLHKRPSHTVHGSVTPKSEKPVSKGILNLPVAEASLLTNDSPIPLAQRLLRRIDSNLLSQFRSSQSTQRTMYSYRPDDPTNSQSGS